MDLEFGTGPGACLCCHNYECYGSTVWKGGKAAVGGYTGVVINESHPLPPVLEWGMGVMMMNEGCHATQGLLAQ